MRVGVGEWLEGERGGKSIRPYAQEIYNSKVPPIIFCI